MAVKKHGLVSDSHNLLDLQALAKYIEMMNEQPGYLPPSTELIKNCQDIVKCLARSTGEEEQRWDMLQSIEEYLVRVVNTVHADLRADITNAILDKFYSYISDPQSDANAAITIALTVLDTSNTEQTLTAARWLVQRGENGPAGEGLRASLSCLYSWLVDSQNHTVLAYWIMAFIKALEESERFDLLIEVSVENIDRLFCALENPAALRQPVADVIFHVLASLRHSPEAFDKLSNHVGRVLTALASDSGQFSRQQLQNVVDILTATVDHLVKMQKARGDEITVKNEYAKVTLYLERHMVYRGDEVKMTTPWLSRTLGFPFAPDDPALNKVGLINLGNTCYKNSVTQALLCNRRFSTLVMTRMSDRPYWSPLAMLFAMMTFSVTNKLNPAPYFCLLSHPNFATNTQHDSSEYLGYLLELLQTYEKKRDKYHDYSQTPVLAYVNRWRAATQQFKTALGYENILPESPNSSVSPRAGGSDGGSTSVASSSQLTVKRTSSDDDGPAKKRKREAIRNPIYLRYHSVIDTLFAGVIMTRVVCGHCKFISLSRDVFRELQLAYPEQPGRPPNFSVQSLLEFFCTAEQLVGENQYKCLNCGVLRNAERKVTIETSPNYLTVVLKNFKYEPKIHMVSKLTHTMFYDYELTLPNVLQPAAPWKYELYASVVHSGSNLDSGHYYTIAKDNGRWHLYNDVTVSPVSDVCLNELDSSSTPYIMFYRRTDVEEGAPPSLAQLPTKVLKCINAHNKDWIETNRDSMTVSRP